eukprot:COSAG06_NODE_11474_length_1504_cov_1.583630_1_plen_211_part_10
MSAAINSAAKAVAGARAAEQQWHAISPQPAPALNGDDSGVASAVEPTGLAWDDATHEIDGLSADGGDASGVDVSLFRPDAEDSTRELTSWEREQLELKQQLQQHQQQQQERPNVGGVLQSAVAQSKTRTKAKQKGSRQSTRPASTASTAAAAVGAPSSSSSASTTRSSRQQFIEETAEMSGIGGGSVLYSGGESPEATPSKGIGFPTAQSL